MNKEAELKARLQALQAENTQLRAENEALRAKVSELEATIIRLEEKIEQLTHGLKKARHREYGPSSETLAALALEEDESSEDEAGEQAPKTPLGSATLHRRKPGRRPLPEDLPREEIRYELPPHARLCATCGKEKGCIGETRFEQLDIIPAVLKVLVHIRLKYACRTCQNGVVTALMPPQPLPKSRASPGLLAHSVICKFLEHQPLYRQEKSSERLGFALPREVTCQWIIKCATLLRPLYAGLKKDILQSDYIQADESTLQVLKEPGRKAQSPSYAWIYKTGYGPSNVVFDYQPTRAQSGPKAMLADFKGYLQTDGYKGYNTIKQKEDVMGLGCWLHMRRKFVEVVQMVKRPGKAVQALEIIGQIYAIEKQAREQNLSPPEILALRQDKAKPLVEAFKAFLDEQIPRVLPQSPLGKAVRYALNQWPSLTLYLNDGRLQIDNNAVENVIRPLALGRKNWLFADSVAGAEAAMILYSLLSTCIANGRDPYTYFRTLFTVLPSRGPHADVSDLLPSAIRLDDYKLAA